MDFMNGGGLCCSGVRQQAENDMLMEAREEYNDSNDEEEEEEEEESASVVLHDCAPHCRSAPEQCAPRPPPPRPHIAASVRCHTHHHHHGRPSSPLTNHCQTSRSPAGTCNLRWDVALLRALRREPLSYPDKRQSCSKRRQPGRVDISFIPKKGDLIIHHDSSQWRRVLEFYDPISQRLQDGDILIRVRLDSFSCVGIVLMKGTGYMYHRGHWMFLGTDTDQISQYFRGH